MSSKKITPPNEDYLKEYGSFKRIYSIQHFLSDEHVLPQQAAIWRSSFFHHYIFIDKFNVDENHIKILLIHLINKKPNKMAASLFSVVQSDSISRIALKEVTVVRKNNEYKLKNGHSLLNFDDGIYFLGDYNEEIRKRARDRAIQSVGSQEMYSGESYNCEHFSNWCFIDKPVSYQSTILNPIARLADAALSTSKCFLPLAAGSVAAQSALIMATASSSSSALVLRVVGMTLQPLESGVIGVAILAPVEALTFSYSFIKMKKAVKLGKMDRSDMHKEVTKKLFGSAGCLAGNFALTVAGATIGTAVCPGPGTIVGGAVGGLIGGLTGKFGGTFFGACAYKVGHKIKKKYKNRKHKNLKTYRSIQRYKWTEFKLKIKRKLRTKEPEISYSVLQHLAKSIIV